MKYPDECPVFVLKKESNDHWRKGDIVELLEVERMTIAGTGPGLDYRVMHHCDPGRHSHIGYAWTLDNFRPLTQAARDMLAIARSAR